MYLYKRGVNMFEKVNPSHPDKIADRIAGAIVDLAYKIDDDPKIAVEVLIGHGECVIMVESSITLKLNENRENIKDIVKRIAGDGIQSYEFLYSQDYYLAKNQKNKIKCGDNGIFKGVPISSEENKLIDISSEIYKKYGTDGKYIIDGDKLIICQSNADEWLYNKCPNAIINPLGEWTGGLDVDTGATNRKLGSDMGRAVTGGGLHGKDLSKADVSVNIYAHMKAQNTGKEVNISCAIGDEYVDGKPYSEIVEMARTFIQSRGGFESFAEWGLI